MGYSIVKTQLLLQYHDPLNSVNLLAKNKPLKVSCYHHSVLRTVYLDDDTQIKRITLSVQIAHTQDLSGDA